MHLRIALARRPSRSHPLRDAINLTRAVGFMPTIPGEIIVDQSFYDPIAEACIGSTIEIKEVTPCSLNISNKPFKS